MQQDYTGIPEDLKKKLLKWEQNTPANKQVAILSDIADISQEMLSAVEKNDPNSNLEKMGALLVDMRGALRDLNDKEAPEAPDTSKPVIDAISKLERALMGSIKAIDTKPVVNVPQANAPVVNVDAPVVKVDNKEIAKILKTDLPKAFNEAIQSIVIPENDDAETNALLQELSQKLDNIDVGVRLKPQSPTKIAVTTLAGGDVTDVNLKQANTILFASISASASGDNQVVAGVTSKKIKVLSVLLVSSGTVSVKWRSNTTDKSGTMPLVANSGFSLAASSPGQGHYFETAVGEALNINLSGAVAVTGHISYYTE